MKKRTAQRTSNSKLLIDGCSLTFERLVEHLRTPGQRVELTRESWKRVDQASRFFDRVRRKGVICYGINTGFGDLVSTHISTRNQNQIQRRLVLSHAVGAKDTLSANISKAILLLRLNSFARGASGIRPSTVERMLFLYNNDAYPEIYSSGSLGASGDLAPLSHLAAFMIGEGWGFLEGQRLHSRTIHHKLGIKPTILGPKEGLSLVNGTSAMVAVGVQAVHRIRLYTETMIIGMALLLSRLRSSLDFVNPKAFDLKTHNGAKTIAENLHELLPNVRRAHTRESLQAPYSIRCAPFVLGSLIDALENVIKTLQIETNSANDNPLFLEETSEIYHGGHFHGHPVAVELDRFRIAAAHLTGIMDRQLDYVMDRKRKSGFNAFLAVSPEDGYCGFEGAQYLVTSLHAENKLLSSPCSVQTLPTNGGNQDYVSLGLQSALWTLEMARNTQSVLAVYLLAVNQIMNLTPTHSQETRKFRQLESCLGDCFGGLYRDDSVLQERISSCADDSKFTVICQKARNLYPNLKGFVTNEN